MHLLIEDVTAVTANARNEVLPHAWIEIRDGQIVAISDRPIEADGVDRRVDGSGRVVMPGIVNAHTHLFQTLIRGVYEQMPFLDWLRAIYRCGAYLTREDCFVAAQLGCVESIKGGVTTVVDHHFLNRGTELPEGTLAGMESVGVRRVIARTIMDVGGIAPPEVVETPAQGLRSVEDLLRLLGPRVDRAMCSVMTGPNTPGASATAELARATHDFAEQHGIGQSMHVAESASVVRAVRERHGHEGVVAWLDDAGALGPGTLAAHSVHLTSEEIRTLAARGVSVAHNPVSNLFLGDGIAPVVEMLQAGVNVALGTDGAASNNTQDMFQVLKMAPLLQRGHLEDPDAVPPTQAIRMATINGARALGLDRLVGSLEPGKRADLIMLDLFAAPHTVAVHNVLSHLVHCASAADVQMTMVDGQILMERRELCGLDEQKLLADAQAQGEDLVRRLSAA